MWQSQHQAAFEKLKELLLSSEALAFPRYDLLFYLAVHSSSKGIGYMLYQKHPSENNAEISRVVRSGFKVPFQMATVLRSNEIRVAIYGNKHP